MDGLAVVCFWCLAGIALHNTFWTLLTVGALRAGRRAPLAADEELPKVAILLCLRGADPSLASCLRRLLRQDYPNYELFITIDSESDPAWQIVQSTIEELQVDNVHVAPLYNRLSTCSLKCSSLVQLVDELDDSHKVLVLADADLESHSTWLRELVAPLADSKIGATFGNRWFMPTKGWFGSLIRQVCNGPGLIVMHAIGIPWAGSLAIRSDVFRRTGLRDKWSRSIVDDGPVRMALKEQKLKLQFVPSLIMANREDCSLGFAFSFMRRQLTWTRIYVRSWWPALLIYTILAAGLWTVAVCLTLVCAFQGLWEAASLFGAGAALLGVAMIILWLILDACARHIVRKQDESTPTFVWTQLPRLPFVLMAAIGVQVWALILATVRRRVVWRGVTYEIHGPWHVRLLKDRANVQSSASTSVSI